MKDDQIIDIINQAIENMQCPCGCSEIDSIDDLDKNTKDLARHIVTASFHAMERTRILDQEKALKFVLERLGRDERKELYGLFVGREQK